MTPPVDKTLIIIKTNSTKIKKPYPAQEDRMVGLVVLFPIFLSQETDDFSTIYHIIITDPSGLYHTTSLALN